MRWRRVVARLRMPLVWYAIVTTLLAAFEIVPLPGLLLLAIWIVAMAVYLRVGTVRSPLVEVEMPVSGRWRALNSPADRVPSHQVHAYGQTYAVDLLHEPKADARPGTSWWPLARRPNDFPGFGQEVFAAADGVVTYARDRARDHWTRSSIPGIAFFFVEGGARELLGPGRVLGNQVVLDLGDCRFALYAHLKRGSVRVRAGQRVVAGEPLAECGNSGNSTEPHLHFQVMDHPSAVFAAGLPIRFTHYRVDGEGRSGVPGRIESFVATPDGASGFDGRPSG